MIANKHNQQMKFLMPRRRNFISILVLVVINVHVWGFLPSTSTLAIKETHRLQCCGNERLRRYEINMNIIDAQSMRNTVIDIASADRYKDTRVAILGGGAFSLAMAKVLSYKNISMKMLVRNETVASRAIPWN